MSGWFVRTSSHIFPQERELLPVEYLIEVDILEEAPLMEVLVVQYA